MRILIVLLLTTHGCLAGCQLSPVPADKLFGVSNPSMKMKVPGYGTLEIPTDFKGKFKIDKSPDGALKIDVTIDSKASEVVDAEGRRIPAMEATRAAEFTAILEVKRMEFDFWKAVVPEAVGLLRSMIPVPTAPGRSTAGTGPAPVP